MNKTLQLVLSYLTLALFVSVTAFTLWSTFKLEFRNEALKEKTDSLTIAADESYYESKKKEMAIDSLIIEKIEENTVGTVDNDSNVAEYDLTVYLLDATEDQANLINDVLTELGYNPIINPIVGKKPSWMAYSSTVLYYSPKTKGKAEYLAKELSSVTDSEFLINRGAGLGVKDGRKDSTFFIHFVPIKSASNNNWFPVIASIYNRDKAILAAKRYQSRTDHPVHVYEAIDKGGEKVFAITLGGYLSEKAATKRANEARIEGLSRSAYPWRDNRWGSNLLDKDN